MTFLAWVVGAWFLDDAEAAQLLPTDWYRIAATRAILVLVVAAAFGLGIYHLNRLAAPRLGLRRPSLPMVTGAAFAGIVALTGIGACIQFAVEKPFM